METEPTSEPGEPSPLSFLSRCKFCHVRWDFVEALLEGPKLAVVMSLVLLTHSLCHQEQQPIQKGDEPPWT